MENEVSSLQTVPESASEKVIMNNEVSSLHTVNESASEKVKMDEYEDEGGLSTKPHGADDMTFSSQTEQNGDVESNSCEGQINESTENVTHGELKISDNEDLTENGSEHSKSQHSQSNKKHVAWQLESEEESSASNDKGNGDHLSHSDGVDSVEHTHQQTTSEGCSLDDRNKELTDPEKNNIGQNNENLPSAEEIKPSDMCLSGQEHDAIKHMDACHNCLGESHDSPGSVHAWGSGGDVHSPPTLLSRRRPASANSVLHTNRGRYGEDSSLSETVLNTVNSTFVVTPAPRRLSLPLDNRDRVLDNKLPDICRIEKTKRSTSSSSVVDCFVQKVETETQKAVLGNINEWEKRKSIIGIEDSVSVKDRPPSTSAVRVKSTPRRRPQTAVPGLVPGNRPSHKRMIHSAPARMAPPRNWEMAFSKEELQRALPRRNFFSCHNKALKDAGYDVEEENARPRRRRLLFFHHDDTPDDTAQAAPPPTICEPSDTGDKDDKPDETSTTAVPESSLETAVQMFSFTDRAKRRKSQLPQATVECKPLQLYLTYVNENPAEYHQMMAKSCTTGPAAALHPSSHPADNCHTARLVNMGKVFQERHGGTQKTDEVLRAAYSLNPRSADPHRFAQAQRDKSALLSGLASRKQSSFQPLPRKESAVSAHSGAVEDGSKSGQRSKSGSEHTQRLDAEKPAQTEPLLEMEKRRLKAEEWARTVTTDQLVRAKLQVLKELGHEEQELSQWWLAFRTCFYIRSRTRH